MKRTTRWRLWLGALLIGAGLSPSAFGEGLRRLPADFSLQPSEGSPGKVTFSHASHVDSKKPACVTCHPGTFRILEPGMTANGERIRHAEMEKGRQCGACHGKAAFGFDSCDLCHRG
jgi:c(7)-type cytochrome triheme protein